MRRLRELNQYRDKAGEARVRALAGGEHEEYPQDLGGVFLVPSPVDGAKLRVHAGVGEGWDHLSISRPLRPPSWTEMEFVKRLFFKPDEVAFQLHVAPADHISVHANCLHIWRPLDVPIPMPPSWMV